MGWARLDDGYAMHPKLVAAGLEATGLDARVISHCAKYETDGFVSEDEAAMLATGARKPAELIAKLVGVRRWHRINGSGPTSDCRCLSEHGIDWSTKREGGYIVHDYLAYNESSVQLEARRKADRIRKGSERKAPRNPDGHPPEGQPESGRNPGPPHVRAPGTRAGPVPSSLDKSSLNHQGVAPPGAEEDEFSGLTKVASLVAERRLSQRDPSTVANRRAWLAKVAKSVGDDFGPLIRSSLAEGMAPEQVADAIEPPPGTAPGHVPFDAEAEAQRAAEQAERTDVDEHGRLVVRR